MTDEVWVILARIFASTQLLRQRSHKSIRGCATMPTGDLGEVVMAYRCLVEVHSVTAKTKGEAWTRVFVLFPGYHTETPLASI